MRRKHFRYHLLLIGILLVISLTACQSAEAIVIPELTEPTTGPSPANMSTFPATITPTQPIPPTQTTTPLPLPTPSRRVSLMAVGDIMLGRTIGDLIISEGIESPFEFTAETLRTADITLGNLECPISAQGEPVTKTYAFRAPVAAAESLAVGGFDLVSLANNHVLDYGPLALADTKKSLLAADILSVGAGKDENEAYSPVIIEINGLKIAFLGFLDVPTLDYDYQSWEAGADKPGVAWAHPDRIVTAVRAARQKADVVIVLFHNGYEFAQKVAASQQEVARLAIDSGASLVIGSHPHVLQRIETYNAGLIVYSMGNFVFDNFLFPPNYSAILSVELTPEGVSQYELIDVVVQLNGVPQIMPYDHDY